MFLCSDFYHPIFNIYKYANQIITEFVPSNHNTFFTFFTFFYSFFNLSLMFFKYILAPLQSFY